MNIVKTAAHHGVIQHTQAAAGDHHKAPHDTQHQIEVHQRGAAAHQPAKAPVHRADYRQLVHKAQHRDQHAHQQPQQRVEHKEQHQRDHRDEQRLQHLFHDGVGQHHGIVGQHRSDGALTGCHDGRPEALGQKPRVLVGNAGQVHHAACGQAGRDLGAETTGQQVLEYPARTGGRKLMGPQQAEAVAQQLDHGGQKALARIPHGQDDPRRRT